MGGSSNRCRGRPPDRHDSAPLGVGAEGPDQRPAHPAQAPMMAAWPGEAAGRDCSGRDKPGRDRGEKPLFRRCDRVRLMPAGDALHLFEEIVQ